MQETHENDIYSLCSVILVVSLILSYNHDKKRGLLRYNLLVLRSSSVETYPPLIKKIF
jgi:hypothetical protein